MDEHKMETDGDTLDGNTKQRVSQLKGWFFTWNNYPSDFLETLETVFRLFCKKYVFEKEVGENGTPHIQGCIVLKKPMRWTEFKLPKSIHWEKTRNQEASDIYCQKDHKAGNDCWTFGFPKPIILADMYGWQLEAEKILLEECKESTNRCCHWWWESKGKFGKSSFCKYMAVKHKTVVIQGGKMADIMNIIFNTDMNEVNSIIIDIPRCHSNKVSYSAIECILNGMITNTKFETGIKVFNPPQIMIFCNFHPDTSDQGLSEDRWKIRNIRYTDEEHNVSSDEEINIIC